MQGFCNVFLQIFTCFRKFFTRLKRHIFKALKRAINHSQSLPIPLPTILVCN